MRDLVAARSAWAAPGRGWKVYIVDEVHMLSTPAANALLKTLEEPPGHVVFVLATTDPQKVPPTIRSRTQHLEFRLLGAETLQSLLQGVTEAAGLDLDADAVSTAVRRGRGSARDALSALDQLAASGSADGGRPELGTALDALAEGSDTGVLLAVSALLAGGWGPQQLATELVDDLRQVFLAALAPDLCTETGPGRDRFRSLAEAMTLPRVVRSMELLGTGLVDMRDAPDPQVVLEDPRWCRATRPDLDSGIDALVEQVAALERPAGGRRVYRTVDALAGQSSTEHGQPPPAAGRAGGAPPSPETEPAVADVGRRPSVETVLRVQTSAGRAAPPRHPPLLLHLQRVRRAAPASRAAQGVIDRDSLTQAWGDGLLRNLPARIRRSTAPAGFITVDQAGAQSALPNGGPRRQVRRSRDRGRARPVGPLRVEGAAGLGGGRLATHAPSPRPRSEPGADGAGHRRRCRSRGVLGSSAEPEAQASAAEARLMQAFPGASEVTS